MDPQVLALVALIGGLVAAYLNFRKAPSEREAITVGTLDKVVIRLQAELDRKDAQITRLEAQVDALSARLAALGG